MLFCGKIAEESVNFFLRNEPIYILKAMSKPNLNVNGMIQKRPFIGRFTDSQTIEIQFYDSDEKITITQVSFVYGGQC